MADLIDVYCSDLQTRLSRRLTTSVVDDSVREIEVHLRESVSQKVANGVSERTAALQTLREVGSGRLVADSLVRTHRWGAEIPGWRMIAGPCVCGILAGCLPFAESWGQPTPSWRAALSVGLFALFVLGLGRACLMSRRAFWKPMAAFVALWWFLLMVVFQFSTLYGTSPRAVAFRQARGLEHQREVDKLDVRLKLASAVLETHILPKEFETLGHRWLAPDNDSFARLLSDSTNSTIRMKIVETKEEALAIWLKVGHRYVQNLRHNRTFEAQIRDSWKNQATPLLSLGTAFKMLEIPSILWLLISAFNGLMLGVAKLYESVLTKQWHPETMA